jgi:competence protein ComEA
MRRPADQLQIEDLARRRLDALVAELGGEPPAAPTPAHGHEEPGSTIWDDEPPRGRHAHRPLPATARVGGWLQDRMPETLRGRVALGPAQLGVVALMLACGVLWATWATSRSTAEPVTSAQPVVVPPPSASGTATGSPLALPVGSAPTAATAASATGAAPVTELVVDVQGTVRRPGIVVLPPGSRVVDAVDAAGGYTGRRARLSGLNLARPVVDGEQIVAGRPAQAVPVPTALAGAASASAAGELVSLNTADQAALETLPGVGPVTATAILQWRDEHGPFTAVEQLLEVSGIGDKTLAEIAPFVTL